MGSGESAEFPTSVQEVGSSSFLILLAKSETRTLDVRHEPENQAAQHAGSCETDFATSITFGERQMIAQLIARKLLVSPLITKDFLGCPLLLARGNLASAHLNP
jgi:hypothetical protein